MRSLNQLTLAIVLAALTCLSLQNPVCHVACPSSDKAGHAIIQQKSSPTKLYCKYQQPDFYCEYLVVSFRIHISFEFGNLSSIFKHNGDTKLKYDNDNKDCPVRAFDC